MRPKYENPEDFLRAYLEFKKEKGLPAPEELPPTNYNIYEAMKDLRLLSRNFPEALEILPTDKELVEWFRNQKIRVV